MPPVRVGSRVGGREKGDTGEREEREKEEGGENRAKNERNKRQGGSSPAEGPFGSC